MGFLVHMPYEDYSRTWYLAVIEGFIWSLKAERRVAAKSSEVLAHILQGSLPGEDDPEGPKDPNMEYVGFLY